MRHATWLTLVLVACGTRSTPPSTAPSPTELRPSERPLATDRKATEGEICKLGDGAYHEGDVARACDTGLVCCYRCGVAGCHSYCRTECPSAPIP